MAGLAPADVAAGSEEVQVEAAAGSPAENVVAAAGSAAEEQVGGRRDRRRRRRTHPDELPCVEEVRGPKLSHFYPGVSNTTPRMLLKFEGYLIIGRRIPPLGRLDCGGGGGGGGGYC